MAKRTSNFGFVKPEINEFYDVQVQNENWDKLDDALEDVSKNAGGVVNDTLQIWVDAINGSDEDGDGTYDSPVKTLECAKQFIRNVFLTPECGCEIWINPGTYDGVEFNRLPIGMLFEIQGTSDNPVIISEQLRFTDCPNVRISDGVLQINSNNWSGALRLERSTVYFEDTNSLTLNNEYAFSPAINLDYSNLYIHHLLGSADHGIELQHNSMCSIDTNEFTASESWYDEDIEGVMNDAPYIHNDSDGSSTHLEKIVFYNEDNIIPGTTTLPFGTIAIVYEE